MSNTGWLSPGTTVDDAGVGTKLWFQPDRAQVSDNSRTQAYGGSGGATSHYLKATNFGASIPLDATIDGVVVEFERYANTANKVYDFRIYIGKTGGTFGDENKAAGGYWSTSEAYFSYGGVSDLWSDTFTPAEINNATFGTSFSAHMDGLGFAYLDHIRIKVYYTEPSTNMKINIGDTFKDVDEIKINIGDAWKPVAGIWINIGDAWKVIF